MFKKFNQKEDIASQTLVKSSVGRGIRSKLLEQYPSLETTLEQIIPKKSPLYLVKCLDRVSIVSVSNQYLFFNHFDGPFFPNLKLLHMFPKILPQITVDRGAIKFVLNGADIMCPGLTSKGGRLPDQNLQKGTVVAIMAEGKEHALAIGVLKMSTNEIKSVNSGIGVENIHFLNDGLYKLVEPPVLVVAAQE